MVNNVNNVYGRGGQLESRISVLMGLMRQITCWGPGFLRRVFKRSWVRIQPTPIAARIPSFLFGAEIPIQVICTSYTIKYIYIWSYYTINKYLNSTCSTRAAPAAPAAREQHQQHRHTYMIALYQTSTLYQYLTCQFSYQLSVVAAIS